MELTPKVPKNRESTVRPRRLLKIMGTMAVIAAIWKLPASLAEKHLKNIHI